MAFSLEPLPGILLCLSGKRPVTARQFTGVAGHRVGIRNQRAPQLSSAPLAAGLLNQLRTFLALPCFGSDTATAGIYRPLAPADGQTPPLLEWLHSYVRPITLIPVTLSFHSRCSQVGAPPDSSLLQYSLEASLDNHLTFAEIQIFLRQSSKFSSDGCPVTSTKIESPNLEPL